MDQLATVVGVLSFFCFLGLLATVRCWFITKKVVAGGLHPRKDSAGEVLRTLFGMIGWFVLIATVIGFWSLVIFTFWVLVLVKPSGMSGVPYAIAIFFFPWIYGLSELLLVFRFPWINGASAHCERHEP